MRIRWWSGCCVISFCFNLVFVPVVYYNSRCFQIIIFTDSVVLLFCYYYKISITRLIDLKYSLEKKNLKKLGKTRKKLEKIKTEKSNFYYKLVKWMNVEKTKQPKIDFGIKIWLFLLVVVFSILNFGFFFQKLNANFEFFFSFFQIFQTFIHSFNHP